jgi:uncharacterized BrkB/YihY/UPF0761 family membrane protein
MSRRNAFTLLFLIGYIIGVGAYALVTVTIPNLSEIFANLFPWLSENMWFLQSMISGFAGAFIAVAAAYMWARSEV